MTAGLRALVLIQTLHNGPCLPLLYFTAFWHCAILTFYSSPAFLYAHYITKRSLVKGSSGADAMCNNRKHTPIVSANTPARLKNAIWWATEVQSVFFPPPILHYTTSESVQEWLCPALNPTGRTWEERWLLESLICCKTNDRRCWRR